MCFSQIVVVAAIAGPFGEVPAVEVQHHPAEGVVSHISTVPANECNTVLKYGSV